MLNFAKFCHVLLILLTFPNFCLILLKNLFCLILEIYLQIFVQDYGFCRQNGPEHGQAQDWYLNEKVVVAQVFSNGLCCYSEVLGSLPAFRRYVDNAVFLQYSKKADHPRAMQKFKMLYLISVMRIRNINRFYMKAGAICVKQLPTLLHRM